MAFRSSLQLELGAASACRPIGFMWCDNVSGFSCRATLLPYQVVLKVILFTSGKSLCFFRGKVQGVLKRQGYGEKFTDDERLSIQ
jgi:hypothetical protein